MVEHRLVEERHTTKWQGLELGNLLAELSVLDIQVQAQVKLLLVVKVNKVRESLVEFLTSCRDLTTLFKVRFEQVVLLLGTM